MIDTLHQGEDWNTPSIKILQRASLTRCLAAKRGRTGKMLNELCVAWSKSEGRMIPI